VETDLDRLLAHRPDVVVLDLGQRPTEALTIAVELRELPRVFVGGEDEDVERVRTSLPDARFADWDGIGTILRTAVERPPN
jgi:DNA-binding response OmpR family regulator